MALSTTRRLFAWGTLEDGPTIRTIRKLLEVIPDKRLLASLTKGRGRGRNDVPVQVAWRIPVLTAALRHQIIEHCLEELRRNESLRKVVGIESEEAVPRKWNPSRFLERLGQEPYLDELLAVLGGGDSVRPRARWFVGRQRSSLQHAVAASPGEQGGRSLWWANGEHGGCARRNRSPAVSDRWGRRRSRVVFAMRMGWQIHPAGAHGGDMPRDRRGVGAAAPCSRPRGGCESICERQNGTSPTRDPAEGNWRINPPACFDGREGGFMPPSRKVDG